VLATKGKGLLARPIFPQVLIRRHHATNGVLDELSAGHSIQTAHTWTRGTHTGVNELLLAAGGHRLDHDGRERGESGFWGSLRGFPGQLEPIFANASQCRPARLGERQLTRERKCRQLCQSGVGDRKPGCWRLSEVIYPTYPGTDRPLGGSANARGKGRFRTGEGERKSEASHGEGERTK
jgi:hypothetical protein